MPAPSKRELFGAQDATAHKSDLPLRGTFDVVTACGGNLATKNAEGWHDGADERRLFAQNATARKSDLPLRGTFDVVTACGGNLATKNAEGWHDGADERRLFAQNATARKSDLPLRGTFDVVTACGGNLTTKNAEGWHAAGRRKEFPPHIPCFTRSCSSARLPLLKRSSVPTR